MQAIKAVDPGKAILADPTVPSDRRTCHACGTGVGQSYDGQGALLSGWCPGCGERYSLVPKLTPGAVVENRYVVRGCVGYGGVGWVFLAEDTHLPDKYVVLKGLINPHDRRATDAATRELDFLLEVDHPYIVHVSDFIRRPECDGDSDEYIVMDYVRGPTVANLAHQYQERTGRGIPAEHVMAYCLQMLAALDHLHARRWLHCDITTQNLMVAGSGVKLIDLGGGCRIGTTGHKWGTPGFRASEVEQTGLPTVRSDVYSAGKTLETMFRWSAEYRDRKTSPAAEALATLISRATAKDPADRFCSAAEMATQLSGVLRDFVALRTKRPVPTPADVTFFGPEITGLPDGVLGSVPPLSWWMAEDAFHAAASGQGRLLPDFLPDPVEASALLPAPRPDPGDPAAYLVLSLSGTNPAATVEQLTGESSAEADLLRCRAELSRGALVPARDAWARAERQCGHGDWRIRWHKALVELATGDAAAAFSEFVAVYRELPGELVPKLGLGLCAEYLGDLRAAERRYQTVWQADRSYVTAAFGLARTWMRRGDRSLAVAAVDEVPDSSRHAPAARITAFRLLTGMSERSGRPAQSDLDEAEKRMKRWPLRGDDLGEAYDGLRAMFHEARLWRACSEPAIATLAAVAGLRSELERCYRDLASHAASERQHTVLVDLANQVRPRTLD